jgi:sodium/potassium-transporting ATPase subunit alpha
MDITTASTEEVLARLASRPEGLAADEARARLAQVGLNQVERAVGLPPWRRFTGSFTHFFALLLWLAAAMAAAAEIAEPGQGMLTLAAERLLPGTLEPALLGEVPFVPCGGG